MNQMKDGQLSSRVDSFTIEQNDKVYERLASGDVSARNEMIEGNMALVVYRVEAYLRLAPQMSYYRDDMIASGYLGLCDAVQRMSRNGNIRKPTAYISKAIDKFISHAADESNTIVVPYQVQALARAEGKPLELPRMVSDKALVSVEDISFLDYRRGQEVVEDALVCCVDDTERQIVSMSADGSTQTQIGEALKIPQYRVSRIRKAIFKRFNERCPEFRETERAKKKRLEKEAAAKAKREAKKAVKEAASA